MKHKEEYKGVQPMQVIGFFVSCDRKKPPILLDVFSVKGTYLCLCSQTRVYDHQTHTESIKIVWKHTQST